MHDDAYNGGRYKQVSFTSDFLSFVVVELIWFFHGALQLYLLIVANSALHASTLS